MNRFKTPKWAFIFVLIILLLPLIVFAKSKHKKAMCREPMNCQHYLSCEDENDTVIECTSNYVFDEELQKCVRAVTLEDFQCLILAAYLSEEKNSLKKDKKKFSSLIETKQKKKPKKQEEETDYEVDDIADDGKTYKRMCVVTNWSQFRPGRGRFSFDFIDSKLCNHIVYASVKVVEGEADEYDTEQFEIQSVQHNEKELYSKLRSIKSKSPSIKLILRITDENGRDYSKLSKSFDTRLSFVNNVFEYIQDNGFDGVELEWRWPAGPSGLIADKENFNALLKDLRFKFSKKYIIGIIMSPLIERIQSYNLVEVNKYVDYVNVETFDYYGPWDKKTGLMSPLGKMDEQFLFEAYMNVEGTVGYLKSLGLLAEKIVIGLAAYSRSYTLQHPMANRVNDLTVGTGFSGSFTKTNGMLANYELCEVKRKGNWKEKWHPMAQVPFMFDETEWVSYENEESLMKKIEFVKTNDLAGACVYSIDLDDFRGMFCNKGPYPFLKMSLGLLATSSRIQKTSLHIEDTTELITETSEIDQTFKTKKTTESKLIKKLTTPSIAYFTISNSRKSSVNPKKIEASPDSKAKVGAKFSYVLITPPSKQKNNESTKKPQVQSRPRNLEVPVKLSKSSRKINIEEKEEKEEKEVKDQKDKKDEEKLKIPNVSIIKSFEKEDDLVELPVPEKLLSNDINESDTKSSEKQEQPIQNQAILNQLIYQTDNKCEGKKNGIYREENDCAAFYVCEYPSQVKVHNFRCPEGLIFNMRDCTCDWPKSDSPCIVPLQNNLCKETQTNKITENLHYSTIVITTFNHITKPVQEQNTAQEPPSISISPPPPPPQLPQFPSINNNVFTCSNKQQGTYPDPYDCTKFYYCQPMPNEPRSLTHEFRCPHGLHFNINICRCDWPNNNCIVPNHISYPCW